MCTRSELIGALTRPGAYPHAPDDVSVLQTHISMLFFAGDRVYKVKKELDLGFVDYSTLEKRRHFCEEEVRLNRRLAEGVYLGVAPITCDRIGRIAMRGDGEVIEYAVEMKRLPAERMLAAMLERGEIDNATLNGIVELLVVFHRDCSTGDGVDEFASADELRGQMRENFEQSERFAGSAREVGSAGVTMSSKLHRFLRRWCERFLDDHGGLFKRRIEEGRVREGHGDLHAGNICLLKDRAVIYDCIEFTRRFRCRDVACEVGFLAMDLDYRGYRGFSGHLCRRYAELADDRTFGDVLPFYKAHLAFVRGKVASLRAVDESVREDHRAAARREAASYVQLAATYTLPPAAILTCGLPASGKSRVARAVSQPFEAVMLRSDIVRKQLAGLQPTERGDRAGRDIYTTELTDLTYRTMLERAAEALDAGRSVVLDATFASRRHRAMAVELLRHRDVAHCLIHLDPPEHVIAERMRGRSTDREEVSDADWNVYQQAKRTFEPPMELPASARLTMHEVLADEAVVAMVLDVLAAPPSSMETP